MQKFFGFDSTIGVGRNFGFKAGEVLTPLEKPVITSISEDADMAGLRIEFAQFGDFDSFSIYRSDTPMDINNLPPPIASALSTMYYVDATVVKGKYYFYRVGVTRAGYNQLSDEVFIDIPRDEISSEVPTDYILAYDFNGDFLDKSTNALDGIQSGNTSFVAGRKSGTQAISFTGGKVRTPQVLPVNSEKLTFSFWLNTNSVDSGYIFQIPGAGGSSTNTTRMYLFSGTLIVWSINGGQNQNRIDMPPNNTWNHFVIEIDRAKAAAEETKFFVNDALSSATLTRSDNLSGVLGNQILHIGQTDGNSQGCDADMQDLRIYNRLLTDSEKTQLFNE